MKRSAPLGLRHLRPALDALASGNALRVRPPPVADAAPSFCSNDYLGLAGGPDGTGAGASRLVAGEHRAHRELEDALAAWLHADAALLFTSGYAANVGTVSALAASRDDLIVSDALNHASLVDGCRLAKGTTVVVPHLDVDATRTALRGKRRGAAWVLTESYFSMDADSPDLAALRAVCDEAGAALVVDEAHALGVLGPDGRGLCAEVGVVPDVLVGTLGKSFGAGGAFVVGCEELSAWLWNRARSFVFSTGLSPLLARVGLTALAAIRGRPELRRRARERAEQLRVGLREIGLSPLGYGHIVPVVVGESRRAVQMAEGLKARGFHVQAIRPPSVASGTARLRFTASAAQSEGDVDRLLAAVAAVVRGGAG